ncbi:MAG: YidC/Oxa1 family membrane protein insertase [Candidatus Pacebacteria bacterium]|nr:YidC/Oxa1 family membrane protein insertase [Candidatus Paceibacterota bacterium]MDD3919166.1 YidC/Oxa1 family membrane protein insertase [Candidatus Paceibacterota bacterium]
MFEFIGIIFNLVLYQPILNFLLWLYLTIGSFGVAVLILTILIRLALWPLNNKSLKSQKELQEIQPLIKEIQTKHKDDSQKQAEELMKIYKEKGFNPFAGIWYMLLQIPIIIALYRVIMNIASGTDIQNMLYSFVNFSGTIEPMFLGINLSESNLVFAIIVAAAQFYQLKTTQIKQPTKPKEEMDQTEKMQNMMQKQMLILFPIFTLFILAYLPSALGLYWLVITIFSIIQQKIILKN